MKKLILLIAMRKAREILDKIEELDNDPEAKELILAEVEEWWKERLGIEG